MFRWLDDHFERFLGILAVALLLALGMGIYHDATAEKFSLRKDGWECSRSHVETSTTFIPMDDKGNQMPIVSSNDVCDEWRRK